MNYKKQINLPYFPFFTGDYKKDIKLKLLTAGEKGFLLEIWVVMWESDKRCYLSYNNKPIEIDLLLNLIDIKVKKEVAERIIKKFIEEDIFSIDANNMIYSKWLIKLEGISKGKTKDGRQEKKNIEN